jgi:2,4-dienoyl-CoA reductase-like NADH-dependent reductase (Old Yellow Enzyme family)/NADPH-dependent 2,4-dienoyl-CoA reductase/sulfur reductase-like enzyme
MSKKLNHLMAPGKIGSLELRNRIIMTPMGSNTAEEGGFCGEQTQAYYEARAAGGAAMVIMGSVSVGWPEGSANWRHIAISDDKYIPGLKKLVGRVHAHGCKAAVQLHHGGLMAQNDSCRGEALLCPSVPEEGGADELSPYFTHEEMAIISEPCLVDTFKLHYKEADNEDIARVVDLYAHAAVRAKRIGFDGAEIHAGHGYLISTFLSPQVNARTDQYGGCIENRARLLVEVIKRVRERVGKDFPIWFRLDSNQFAEGGITNEDAQVAARLAVEAGADAVHCSADGDHHKGTCYTEGHATHTPAGFLPYASAIKNVVDVPVIMPGRIEPEVGDRLIAQGKIDFVTMGRKLLADPELPNKVKQGRMEDIRPCILCYTCISSIFKRSHIRCAVNATTGYENQRQLIATDQPKKVLVIGGGPGGMEAARVAALRGHQVTLVEKSRRLGGTVFFSGVSYPPNSKLVKYLEHQLRQLPVDIHLGVTATVEFVQAQRPAKVVVAVGAGREMPQVPGIDLPHVLSGDDMRDMITGDNAEGLKGKFSNIDQWMLTAGRLTGITAYPAMMRELSKLWLPLGKRVVLVGGGLVALELAEYLAERGRQVTILEESDRFGRETPVVRRWRNLADCRRHGVSFLSKARLTKIATRTLTYLNERNQERTIAADHVIVTSGTVHNHKLANSIRARGFEVELVGDCSQVGYIEGAMHGGHQVGLDI